ncbi:hypothetical protein H8S95_03005 [Pontibacter sp. KCTC 32443]|uniref:hypothetical protein n=1 Tax=Pontibacter TaxID=323449 RepID=UPI00164D9A19|nr:MULTISPECIES: hypothetical protein [Pontibacter]MBC5773020.1 hypothetical protein [Pontibacter sp. KCTC 32443]
MKKILVAGIFVLGSVGMFACERQKESETSLEGDKDNSVVVDRDSVATEYEVTETVVDYDTTTRTKTVDAETEKENEREKDKDRD